MTPIVVSLLLMSSSVLLHRPELSRPANTLTSAMHRRGTVWLDSSLCVKDKGRQSFFATEPVSELRQFGNKLVFYRDGRQLRSKDGTDIVDEVRHMGNHSGHVAIGYIGYEATLPYLGFPTHTGKRIPDAAFLVYKTIDEIPPSLPGGRGLAPTTPEPNWQRKMTVIPSMSREEYCESVRRVKHHIRMGDIYQANLTCRFTVVNTLDPVEVYSRLRQLNPAPYAAFLNFGDFQILSSSPERMFTCNSDWITCCPIKGTIQRGENERLDRINLYRLVNSTKDKAELLMIVDLVRNDLGKVARFGSVTVDSLFRPECYSSVYHLVSDVSARLRDGIALGEICRALLPGGSITGAPKRRAVEILSNLETVPRSVYTGCIGYIAPDRADFSIAIRTMVHQAGEWRIHAGSGIVADSDPESEYQEMLLKAQNLFRSLQ